MKNLCNQSLAWLLLVSLLLESCHNLIDKEAPIPQDSCQGGHLAPLLSLRATNQEEEAVTKLAPDSQAGSLLTLQIGEKKGKGMKRISSQQLLQEVSKKGNKEQTKELDTFSTFPKEIWQHILSYVPAEHIGKMRQANRAFYRLTTGYNQPGLVGVDNKPNHHIKVDSWMINRRINFREARFKALTPSTIPSLLFYQFLEKAMHLPQSFWQYLVDTHIKEIDLTYEYIGDLGVAALAKYLEGTNVRAVSLSYNQISASGAQPLAAALSKTQIHTLNLGGNWIGASGAQSLAAALSKTQIHTLDLGFNQIGTLGVQSLATELSKTQIHTLSLGNNQIGDSGAQWLAAELSKTKIHTLNLWNNQISASTKKLLSEQYPNIIKWSLF